MMKYFLPGTLVSVVLMTSIAGCHKEKPLPSTPPMQAQAPSLPDAGSHPQPVEIIPLEPAKRDTKTAVVAPPPPPTPLRPAKPEKHHKSKSQPTAAAPTPAAASPEPTPATSQPSAPATTTAAAPHPAAGTASPIGQLTEGDTSGTAQVQDETDKLIQSIEKGLAGIQRPLDTQEQETAKQIKKFIEQAREALAAQDVGGAHTLAVKANLLLTELRK